MAHIKTYARLKPSKKRNENFSVENDVLTIHVPDGKDNIQMTGSSLNRISTTYDVSFDRVFSPDATQQDVFDNVAKDIIQSFLTGFNGTIFAYGQTGTGKTYTVEGNSCRYQSRGLATRALSMIYEELEKRTEEHISVYLSFLEIYQEVAYDLLNPASRTMLPVLPFSKVTVVEGPNGSCILRGLSVHLASNEDVAQMLLLQGQANRRVAETTVNQRSSRSHAVFSVYLQSRKKDSQIILNSKLHLVDLAGSERVSKTGVDGQQLTEAKSINLSLHHLETVIIFLQAASSSSDDRQTPHNHPSANNAASANSSHASAHQKSPSLPVSRSSNSMMSHPSSDCFPLKRSRKHIPYRNSLLTMILKDSLGGNCLTAMIATLCLEPENICESLSTCRFAQRVARVANFAKRNEEIDDKMLIKKLKIKVAQLETKLALILAQSEAPVKHGDGISPRDDVDCQQVIEEFLQGIIDDPVSAGISTQFRFRECLYLMKSRMLQNNIPTIKPLTASLYPSPTHHHPKYLHDATSNGSAIKRGDSAASSKRQETLQVAWAEPESRVKFIETSNSAQSPVAPSPKFYTPRESATTVLSQGDPQTAASPKRNINTPVPSASSSSSSPPPPPPSAAAPPQEQLLPLPLPQSRDGSSSSSSASKSIIKTDAGVGGPPTKVLDDMDDIDRLLLEASSTSTPNSYKTPFERKREQKIKKLGKALSSLEEEKTMKEQQLQLMKQDTVLDSLRMEEDGYKLKLQVADEQVADQHAYILHLKHIESDPELLAQEALVEKQLQKRQVKFKSKLKDVQERRTGVEKELAEMSGGRAKNSPDKKNSRTFEDRYGQFRQNRGSLNTRQVFEMLKSEEKKQKKEMTKVEREKTMVKTKQLELKEMATWEKLRELKQMLKMSQQHGQNDQQQQQQQQNHPQTGEFVSTSDGNYPATQYTNSGIALDLLNPSSNDRELPSNSLSLLDDENREKSHSEFISEYIQSVEDKIYRKTREISDSTASQNKGNNCDESWALTSLQQQNSDSSIPLAIENYDVSSSLIPHPSEKFTLEDHDSNREDQQKQNGNHFFNNNEQLDDNNNSSYDFDFVKQFHQTDDNKVRQSETDLFPSWSAHKLSLGKEEKSHPHHSDVHSSSTTTASSVLDNRQNNGVAGSVLTRKLESHSPSMEDIMEMLTPTTVVKSKSSTANYDESPDPVIDHKIIPPSEYINSMTEQERFDARKMGLSSRTFESALSHMLDDQDAEKGGALQNVPDLPYSVDVYENFTRKPSSTSRPYHQSPYQSNRNRHRATYHHYNKKSASSSQRYGDSRKSHNSSLDGKGSNSNKGTEPSATDKLDKVLEEHSTWGPNLKNVSIADRLSGLFDDTPSTMLPSQNSANQNKRYGEINGGDKRVLENAMDPRHRKFQNGLEDLEAHDDDGYNEYDDDEEEEGEEKMRRGAVVIDRSCEEADLFLGQHTPRMAITATRKEDGEKTFMSRVVSERERVAKIRKARHAAEVIQKYWRTFKSK